MAVFTSLEIAVAVSLVAIAGVIAGVRLSRIHAISRALVALSGGILIGVALFWVLPELTEYFGAGGAVGWLIGGFGALWITDRYIYHVCPSCSHGHDHDGCSTRLHGFAAPLLIATGFHSFLDGWIVAASADEGARLVIAGVVAGIAIHKLPEGLALGVIVRASMSQGAGALWGSIAAEALTVVGAVAAMVFAPVLGTKWAHALLALAAGGFVFLGYHAVHSEYQRGGTRSAFVPAFAGAAGAAAARFIVMRWGLSG